jgi:hypothetical protein
MNALVDRTLEGSSVTGSHYTNALAKAVQHGVDLKEKSDGSLDER